MADRPLERFFGDLVELTDFAQIAERERYSEVPDSFHVVITDVRGSTAAIEAGRYKDVNALGVASIVALRNALPDVELAYVFGGDGATLLLPGSRLDAARAALRGIRKIGRETFGLELRVASIPVSELRAAGDSVKVARFRASPHACFAMFAGSGFAEAERRIKSKSGVEYEVSEDGDTLVNLEGFECRWRPVESRRGHIVSLLVASSSEREAESTALYREVLRVVETLGGGDATHPVSLAGLQLNGLALENYSVEARLRTGQSSGPSYDAYSRQARKQTLTGRVLMGLGVTAGGFDGKTYLHEMLANTDFRKFDEMLRMVLDLSADDCQKLESYLEREHVLGRLVFGLHRSEQALVTCYVRSYQGDHVHFVDGSNGGYALAAKALKARLRARVTTRV